MNQMSTPPNGDVSYLALCASLYFFASSTQHSRPSFVAVVLSIRRVTTVRRNASRGRRAAGDARARLGARGARERVREARKCGRGRPRADALAAARAVVADMTRRAEK
jgi:hypothetical protein